MANHDCQDCARNAAIWQSKGRCVAPLPYGAESIPISWRDSKGVEHTAPEAYPVEFDVCPRGLLRVDLHPDETGVAEIVDQAAYADTKRRWPEVPARLWELLVVRENAVTRKQSAYQEATLKVI